MITRIRQAVALVSVPFVLASGAVFAGKPGPIEPPYEYMSVCRDSLRAASVVVSDSATYTAGSRWTVNRDALLAKLMGIDLKLLEDPPKESDAMVIVGDIMLKVDAWSDPDPYSKPKLTELGASEIQRTVMSETGEPKSVANCIPTADGSY